MDVNEERGAGRDECDAEPKGPGGRELMGYVRSGLAYVERYGGPRARVARALERRAWRKGLENEAAADMVAAAMAKLDDLDIIDDTAFAASKARGLRGRGASRRGALAKLLATGLDRDVAAAALDAVDAETQDPDADDDQAAERTAAARYAERRRLGPWRLNPDDRPARRDRDVAALARAGFPVRLAMEIIDGD